MTDRTARLLGAFPQFQVTDVVRTAEYYRDVLGFRIHGHAGDPPVFAHVNREGVTIQFGRARNEAEATRPAAGIGHNVYIWTDHVDPLLREIREKGADVIEGPVDRVYQCREIIVRDVNGLVLCFAQDIEKKNV